MDPIGMENVSWQQIGGKLSQIDISNGTTKMAIMAGPAWGQAQEMAASRLGAASGLGGPGGAPGGLGGLGLPGL